MKTKEGFLLREIADLWVVIPVGSAITDFREIITLNKSGAFLWSLLAEGAELEDLTTAILDKYDIDEATALADIKEFISVITSKGLCM